MTAVQDEAGQRAVNEPVDLRFTPQGAPLAVRWRGRLWPVAADPVHWFSRRNWWESNLPDGLRHGNVVDLEFWRLQVRATSTSPMRTLEVRKQPGWDGWHLVHVSDE